MVGTINNQVFLLIRTVQFRFVSIKPYNQTLILNGSEIIGTSNPLEISTRYPSKGSNYTSAAFYGNFK